MDLAKFREVNISRARRWHVNGLDEWTEFEWGAAAAGEMGELLNELKKLRRHQLGLQQANSLPPKEMMVKIAKEFGDVLVYMDLLGHQLGFTFEDAMRLAFNQISEREGFPERV